MIGHVLFNYLLNKLLNCESVMYFDSDNFSATAVELWAVYADRDVKELPTKSWTSDIDNPFSSSRDTHSLLRSWNLKCFSIFALLQIERQDLSKFFIPINKSFCEPHLSKRGLYSSTSTIGSTKKVKSMMNILSYIDGKKSIIEIANLCHLSIKEVTKNLNLFKKFNLIK